MAVYEGIFQRMTRAHTVSNNFVRSRNNLADELRIRRTDNNTDGRAMQFAPAVSWHDVDFNNLCAHSRRRGRSSRGAL